MTNAETVADLDDDATVFVRSHRGDSIGVVHTDPDCHHLDIAVTVRTLGVVQLPDSLNLCADCVGDPDRGTPPGENTCATREALLDADPDDLRADGGREYVLTCEKSYTNCTTYHLPDPDDPDRPRCLHAAKSDRWRRRDRETLPARMSLCRVCDPDDAVERTNGGPQLAAKLRDPDVSDPSDLVTDGGISASEVLAAAGAVFVVAGNNGGTVHADRDCKHLQQSSRTPRRIEAAAGLPLRADVCRPCAPAEVLEAELVADGGDQCAECGVTTSGAFLVDVDGEVVCEDCAGVRECVRCGRSTDETTLAGDPKCRECQTRKRQQSTSRPVGQDSLDDFVTDGGRRYRCHSRKNDVATLLLTDPLFNRRLRAVIGDV